MTRLGIVVVYLVADEDGPLLDLHLEQIERCTRVPYRIYGSVNRLDPAFLPRLEAQPGTSLHRYPPTGLRGYQEHAYYLERLVETAIADGASHVVMLNVDSFPVRVGWAQELAAGLSDRCPLAAVQRLENVDYKPHPSCIFFARDFWVRHRPRLVFSDEELGSEPVRRYLAETGSNHDTGIGYGYALHRAGLEWRPLLRSNRREDHYIIASVYADLVFHLGGAARPRKIHLPERRLIDEGMRRRPVRMAARAIGSIRRILPERAAHAVEALRTRLLFPAAARALAESEQAYRHARRRLLEDPQGYLGYLRGGEPR